MRYDYLCPSCGIIHYPVPLGEVQCRCGQTARRQFGFAFQRATKDQARWDPVVGEYVNNDREFRTLLAQGQARTAHELGMEVPLATCDARDSEALAELHGHAVAERHEIAEQTERAKHDEKVKANHEQKPKVLLK